MFSASRSTQNEHYIHLGMVGCPRSQRDVEVDSCIACEAIQELGLTGRLSFVRCNPGRSSIAFERDQV